MLAGLSLFLVSVFFIGSENNIFSRTFEVSAVFRNVEGLKAGDNVWLSGVKIGTVSDVSIAGEGRVIVKLALKENQNKFIQTDAVALISTDGLVGNKIVIIRPGQGSESITEQDTLQTVSPTDTQDLMNLARDVGENTRSITSDLKIIADRINKGKGIVGELLNDGSIAQEMRAAITHLTTTSNNTAQASAELNALIRDLQHGDGLLATLISDTNYTRTFEHALTNIEKVSENAGLVSEQLQHISSNINDTDNAAGVLLSDSTVAEQLKTTIENAAQASVKLNENMEALQHNFLFRGFFRKKEKKEKRERRHEQEAASSKSGS